MGRSVWRSVAVALCVLVPAGARGDDTADARAEYERGVSAYGLGNYAAAAQHYEKAFDLKPDPALLYNAAQAHRLAGNQQRALQLYTSYLKVFGDDIANREEVIRHIEELRAAIASQPPLRGTTPNVRSEPMSSPSTTPRDQSILSPKANESAALHNQTNASSREKKPITKRPLFWGILAGAAIVVAVAIGVGVAFGSQGSNPVPTIGAIPVR